MKKIILCSLLFLMMLFATGCGKTTEDDINEYGNPEGTNETVNSNDNDKIELYSDNTKMVFQNGTSSLVYYYEGDKITGYHAYIDYGNAATANYVLSMLDKDESIAKAYTKGRYVVIEYAESEYENTTTDEIRLLYSYLEEVQKKN